MNRKIIALLLGVSCAAGAHAHNTDVHIHSHQCSFGSDYNVRVTSDGIDFNRNEGQPTDVFVHNGHLRVDGREAVLSDTDAASVRAFESDVRSLLPDMASIARDSVDIGYSALTTVAATLAENGDQRTLMLSSLHDRHAQALHRIDDTLGRGDWNQDDIGNAISDDVQNAVGDMVGVVASDIVKAALSGDSAKADALQARVDALDTTINKTVEGPADKLSQRAEALCPRLTALAQLQQQLAYRLPNGDSLQLIDHDSNNKDKASQLAGR